ncbi:hypothetical protein ACMXYN_00605 [Neptuniibacter sp. PT8_73]|uniref:hypothetical protein n=1 Tax=unclassified Neptuniibacter TaxID=2630693 RepID=UPI0039F69B5A
MITHYLELFKFYRKFILTGTLATGGLVFLLSVFVLVASPLYKGVATITMQPTEAELAYTQGWLGVSQFNPAAILTQTHTEQLLSRPVAEKALSLLLQQELAKGVEETGIKGFFKKAGRAAKRLFWRTWNTLNYGKHIPLSESEELLVTLMEATDIEVVEGSYIINIEVLYKDPVIASKVANILAEAYVKQTKDDYKEQAAGLRESLQLILTQKELELSKSVEADIIKRKELGISDITFEREALLSSRDREVEKRADDEITLNELNNKVASLKRSKRKLTRRDLIDKIESDLILSESERIGIVSRIKNRAKIIEEYDQRLIALQKHEKGFRDTQQKQTELKADVEDLRRRMVTVSLAGNTGLSQVRMISPSIAPLYPWFPKVFLFSVAAVITGFIIMTLVVVVIDTTTTRILTTDVLRTSVGTRVLGLLGAKVAVDDEFKQRLIQRISLMGGWSSGSIGVTAIGDQRLVDEMATTVEEIFGHAEPVIESNVERLPVVNSRFAADELGVGQRPIVCVLRPGEVEQDELLQLVELAQQKSGQDKLLFVLWRD